MQFRQPKGRADFDPGRTVSVKLTTEMYLALAAIAQANGYKPGQLLRELAIKHVRENS